MATLPGRYAKFLTALAGNALVFASATYGSTSKWVELATAAAVAFGVLAIPKHARPASRAARLTTPLSQAPVIPARGFSHAWEAIAWPTRACMTR